MAVFIISDLHFGHENMAKKRGFNSVEEHDNLIIERWNSVVKKNDIVYILGDITMEKKTHYPLLNKLRGIKNVVLGNHDRRQDVPELLKYVNSVAGFINYKGYALTHCPIHPMEIGRFRKNYCGHTHNEVVKRFFGLIPDSRYINVCCEKINYTPLKLSE
jgi:calcineurin-like phosphoesterase family protein